MENNKVSSLPAPDGSHLWLLLWKATRSVEDIAHASIQAASIGLTDFAILEALLHKGPLPVNAFRDKVLLSSGSMTAAVDRLEKAGLVERRSTKEDRRMRLVHLTAKGRRHIEPVFRQHQRDMEQVFHCLNSTQRHVMAAMLRRVGEQANALNQAGNKR